jgi:hypothetical protein
VTKVLKKPGARKKPGKTKILPLLALTVVLLAILSITAAAIISPLIASQKTLLSLQMIGLETQYLPAPKTGWGSITYSDAPLDKDGISTVKNITIQYSPFNILLSKQLSLVAFKDLNLFGNWTPGNVPPLDFSGWSLPHSPQKFANIPAQHIRFTDTQLSVLTPGLGGLSLAFDFEGSMHNERLEFQSHLKSAQKYISFSAGANGVIANDFANVDLDLDQGKFEVPEADIKVSRVYGWVNYTKDKSQNKVMSELNAGGMTLLGLPWQGATAAIELNGTGFTISGDAKSTGVDGIELSMNLQKEGVSPLVISGSLHAEKGQLLADYLKEEKIFTLPASEIKTINAAQDLKIDFVFDATGAQKVIRYNLGEENSPPHELVIP